VKYVPDATGDRHFADDLTVDRDDVDGLLSELDEYAVEQALQISENSDDDVEITVLTVGPEDAKDALRKALSMGADKAIHVEDDDLHGTDALGTSLVLAKALDRVGDYDLIVAGSEASDGQTSMVPAMLAERLGLVGLTLLDAATETLTDASPLERQVARMIEPYRDYFLQDVRFDDSAAAAVLARAGVARPTLGPTDVARLVDLALVAEGAGLSGR
jgi:electron transfer flavoprotein beta subunit